MTDQYRSKAHRILEELYHQFHHPKYLSSDPLRFAHRYGDPADQEIVACLSAAFAFGNVTSIKSTLENLFRELGEHPAAYLKSAKPADLLRQFDGFLYRWVQGDDLALFLFRLGFVLREYGSLEKLFLAQNGHTENTILTQAHEFQQALIAIECPVIPRRIRTMTRQSGAQSPLASSADSLLPKAMGGTGKRLHLFLRWVVRPADGIDLGLWQVDPSRLLMPVDTHVFKCAKQLRLTKRRAADQKTVLEISSRLRRFDPSDPIRYDFSMTRPGIMKIKQISESF